MQPAHLALQPPGYPGGCRAKWSRFSRFAGDIAIINTLLGVGEYKGSRVALIVIIKHTGGQPGHQGHTLVQVEIPDEVIVHRPQVCAGCQQDLSGEKGEVVEHRQVHELPPWHLLVQEHQRERVCCPVCHHVSTGTFPENVKAPVQYGPCVQALAVYLSQYQLLSLQRTCEALADLCLDTPDKAPAGTKRLSRLLHCGKWPVELIRAFLWERAARRWQTWTERGKDILAIWDESVWEKPESMAPEEYGPVRSSKGRRLTRIKKGYYTPPRGPIFVPGLHWLAVLLVGRDQQVSVLWFPCA